MPAAPVVETRDGKIEGERGDDLFVFRGIPFARPPLGELRFAPPRPPAAWTGVLPATRFGPAAPQEQSTVGFGIEETSEDCLTLNVCTPGLDDAHRPVMVWIHGGAFVFGGACQPIYDGARLARHGDVVVVTVQYRLGALGFLYLKDLLDGEIECGANVGLLDQLLAITWVHDNIEAFGGDPANVTIFGESAGGMSVGSLLGMPEARGLFHRAIAQSGSGRDLLSTDAATEIARTLLSHLALDPGDARKLLEVPVEALLQAQQRCWIDVMRTRRQLPFRPVVDGVVFPAPPAESIAGGMSTGVPLLVGTTLDEWRFFAFMDPASFALDEGQVVARLDRVTSGFGRALFDAYAAERPGASPSDVWFAIESDRIFRVPSVLLAETQSRQQPKTFSYLFTWPSPIEGLGACHAIDIPFVFDTLDKPGMPAFAGDTAEARDLGTKVQDAWIAFAHTGDPGHAGLPAWPAYDAGRRATMLLGADCHVEEDPLGTERRAWDGRL
jgi:para-nitrobenzyl esterase